MTPRGWACASLLAGLGCVDRTPVGAVWVGVADAGARVEDVAAPPDVGVARRVCDGFERDGVATARDDAEPATRIRIFYIDRDQELRFERRALSDAGRVCGATLGRPDGAVRVVGRPAASAQRILAAFATERGSVALWTRSEIAPPCAGCGACDVAWSPWSPLPDPPAAVVSAPALHVFRAPEQDMIAAVTGADGRLYYTTAADRLDTSWEPWRPVPGQPEGSRVTGAPTLTDWGRHVHVFVNVDEPPRLHETVYAMDADAWIRFWDEHPSPREDLCSAPVARSLSLPGALGAAEMWLAVTSAQGVCWTRRYLDVGQGVATWSPWTAVTDEGLGDGVAAPSAPTLEFSGLSGIRPNGLWLVSVRPGTRSFQFARRDPETGVFGAWTSAPDPLL